MSVWNSLKKAVTGPFRGLGYLAQGKVRKAVGAFGDTAKVAVPIAAGVGTMGMGTALMAGAAAGGGASWGNGENNVGRILKAGAGGAATAASASSLGKLARGIKLPGGAPPAAVDPGVASARASLQEAGKGVVKNTADAIGRVTYDTAGQVVAPTSAATAPTALATTVPKPVPQISRMGKIAQSAKGFAGRHPEIVLQGAGTALDAYGAAQEGNLAARELDMTQDEYDRREAERQRQEKLQMLGMFMQNAQAFRPRV